MDIFNPVVSSSSHSWERSSFCKGYFLICLFWGWPTMLWAFSHKILLPGRRKGKIGFKSVLSLLIGMMETSLIQMASAFHNKILQNAMSWHADSAPSHPWQQAATSWLFPAWTMALVAAHLWSQGLGSLQPTQNPGGWKTTMAIPKQVVLYWQNMCRECA